MKILIVDDEPYTREGLCDLIAQSDLAFDEILLASGGEAALAIMRNSSPDILLCDVRMPGMSGLDLARAVRREHPACRILMMSGYSDREYLKSALNLNASAFIDKPVDEKELFSTLEQAVRECADMQQNTAAVHILRGQELARVILAHEQANEAALEEAIGSHSGKVCRCVLIHPAHVHREDVFAVLRRLGLRGVGAADYDGNDVLFLWHEPGDTLRALCACLTEDNAETCVAVGRVVKRHDALARSYRSARRALSTLFYRPTLRVAYAAGDASAALSVLPPAAEFERALRVDAQEAVSYLESLRNRLLDAPNTPPDLTRTHYHALLSIALHGHDDLAERILCEHGEESLWDACAGAASLDDLETLVWSALDGLRQGGEEREGASHAVTAARRYIHRHFHHETLQLKEIADHVHMSMGHLSARFKREVGFTLRQYITHCRMQQACRLLKETNSKNQDIARQVGYADAYYFGQVFRRETGMSPQQYRKSG